jgi:NMD protein affecting ribosome stability and mRNA decay
MAEDPSERVKALLKKKGNRDCFVCSDKGAVCVVWRTDPVGDEFAVFVCSSCGGIAREKNWRVKQVSLATFSQIEADFLEKLGGNTCVFC